MPMSTTLAPKLTAYRLGIAANDVVANIPVDHGLNAEDNEYVNFMVSPSGGANPSASIYYWNEITEKWTVDTDFSTLTGAGADTPYAFSVPVRGRTLLLVLSAISGGAVDTYANSFGFSNRI